MAEVIAGAAVFFLDEMQHEVFKRIDRMMDEYPEKRVTLGRMQCFAIEALRAYADELESSIPVSMRPGVFSADDIKELEAARKEHGDHVGRRSPAPSERL